MNTSSGTNPICHRCGKPCVDGYAWINGAPFHAHCLQFPAIHYKPMPAVSGCKPVEWLTESDVRRIVREELAALEPKP